MNNIVTGENLEKLRRRALSYGARDLQLSDRMNKKYVITLKKGEKIHFGVKRYEGFLIHRDKSRRRNYRGRASKIKDNNDNLTYKNKNFANYWSYHLLS